MGSHLAGVADGVESKHRQKATIRHVNQVGAAKCLLLLGMKTCYTYMALRMTLLYLGQ